MRNRISNSIHPGSILDSNISGGTCQSSRLSNQLATYYKSKCQKLEKEFDSLLDELDNVKSACDLSSELQRELSERNEEISKLQQVVGELQIHLFREKEKNLKLTAENDELRVQDFENKKRIKALLMVTGMCERKFLHFMTKTNQDKLIPPKLPPKLQKLKETRQKEITGLNDSNGKEAPTPNDADPQVLLLNNQLLASQLEQHIRMTKEEIDVLLKEKEISDEERKIERQRLQKEIDLMSSKLKKSQDLLCDTTGKLVKLQQTSEKEKTLWMEEKERYLQTINVLKERGGIDVSDIMGYCVNGIGSTKNSFGRLCDGRDGGKEKILLEKEQMAAAYQEQILKLEAEVNRLRERAQICRNTFKEKTEKMTAQVAYLKNKYEDLDRRRHLEAEGFRTDIRMLKERVKELEKKLAKASTSLQSNEQQQLLVSARETLNRAKQLERELEYMKAKISVLDSYGDSGS